MLNWLGCQFLIFLLLMIPLEAVSATFEIVFDEGAFKYNPNLSPEDSINKYLARVTLKRDGKVIAKNLKGSTLPDAWSFYQRWNIELKNTAPPTDTDIASIFDYYEKQTSVLRSGNVKLGNTSLADIADILDVLNRVPALKTGQYSFIVGIHRNGNSVHGKPYVPRLLGGTQENPYDPTAVSSSATAVGGFISTINKNNAMGQKAIANGINIHDGRKTKDYKDSEGCLTVSPQDWKAFYKSLPSPGEWSKHKHVGVVSIRRGS